MAISLEANIELPSEVDSVLKSGASGIGLLRSEFMYMNRDDLPGEEEQFAELRDVVQRLDGRPVTIRTLDVGADKLGDGLGIEPGPNPALGLRAIRFSLSRRKSCWSSWRRSSGPALSARCAFSCPWFAR